MPYKQVLTTGALTRRAIVGALPASFFPTRGLSREIKPEVWASSVDPAVLGVPNFYRVNNQIYRSAQPDATGFHALQQMGVASVLSLRQTLSDALLAKGADLGLFRVPIKLRYVAEKNGARVVQAVRNLWAGMQRGPVLVHCHHGADRTGLICALWRVLYQGWSRQSAIDELTGGGYGFHPIWFNIPRYLREVNLIDLRDRIGT